MSFVLGLIIVVAACTVIATLIMVVLEKKKEIALLKALGAKNDAILRIFLYQGAIIGVVGHGARRSSSAGVCCRFLIAYAFPLDPKVYFISQPAGVDAARWSSSSRPSSPIAICLVCDHLPRVYAARLRPAGRAAGGMSRATAGATAPGDALTAPERRRW